MNIGEATRLRIIELCQTNHITVNKLATICGITQSTLSNIIGGRNNSTTISTIKKICDGLNITIHEFFNSKLFENLAQEIKNHRLSRWFFLCGCNPRILAAIAMA